ncbi:MAG: TonB-dependent receptor, partial [Prolixibacteraceae bacterium]|nr:TonB-dependent receptor [Prolixibacteraceae bacterium]
MKQAIRKSTLLLAALICLVTVNVKSQPLDEIRITGNFQNVPLISFLETLKEEYGINIFYREAWVESYSLNTSFTNNPLLRALNTIFLNHELTYDIFQDNSILIYPRRLDTRANFEEFDQAIIIGDPINKGRYKTAVISGRVIDGKTGEPLPGAVIYCYKHDKGTNTGGDGTFSIELPAGEQILKISYMGYLGYDREINLIEPGEVEFELFEESLSIEEVLIIADELSASRTQMSIVQMSSKEMRNLPLLMGERDVLKSIVMLPGIQSVGELSSGFNVRGGNSDQNLILLDGSPIFNTSHLFGFLSMINPDIVNDVKVFKGGLPARYGERVSSVMEVDMKNGNTDHLKIYGGLGLINSRLAIDGPLTKNKKLTFIAGGRVSYTDWALKKVPDADISGSVTNFYDASGKLSYKFDNSNWLNLMLYNSNDEFSTSRQSENAYGNTLVNFELHNRYSEAISGELDLSYSDYKFRLTDYSDGKDFEAYYLDNSIKYNSLKYNLIWHPVDDHIIHSGINIISHLNNPGKISPVYSKTTISEKRIDRETALESAVYLSDEFKLTEELTANAGLRYSRFSLYGPKTVYLYHNEEPKNSGSVIDSLIFGDGDVIKSYHGIEPRIGLNLNTDAGYSFKLSYQKTRQYINQIS